MERLLRYGKVKRVYRWVCLFLLRRNLFFAKKFEGKISVEELSDRLLVHEYGHTIQSLILGPLYLVLIGIPSTLWGFLLGKRRKEKQIPYGAFFLQKNGQIALGSM